MHFVIAPIQVGLLFTLLPFGGWAQSVCPSINFLISRSANLKSTANSHINVVRQADGSYTGFEVTNLPPHEAIAVTPHFERQRSCGLPRGSPGRVPCRIGLLGKLLGKTGAIRAGSASAYDQFGNDLSVNAARMSAPPQQRFLDFS
jgi:hypothetical protein